MKTVMMATERHCDDSDVNDAGTNHVAVNSGDRGGLELDTDTDRFHASTDHDSQEA